MLTTATTMENEFEEELKDHLSFLLWADKVMEEIYNEEIETENYEIIRD